MNGTELSRKGIALRRDEQQRQGAAVRRDVMSSKGSAERCMARNKNAMGWRCDGRGELRGKGKAPYALKGAATQSKGKAMFRVAKPSKGKIRTHRAGRYIPAERRKCHADQKA